MQQQDLNHKIGAQINLIKLAANNRFAFALDNQGSEWLQKILDELNENATDLLSKHFAKKSFLKVSGEVEKKNKQDLGEFLLTTGTISTLYATECIRTLKPMTKELEVPFKIAFLDESLEKSEMFAETDETWIDGQVYEIYYYNKRNVQFRDMVHEQLFLNYDQYPVLDADSRLEGVIQENPES
jgi:uncharacterized metal-binding protein YceD (DUF177 family)